MQRLKNKRKIHDSFFQDMMIGEIKADVDDARAKLEQRNERAAAVEEGADQSVDEAMEIVRELARNFFLLLDLQPDLNERIWRNGNYTDSIRRRRLLLRRL